MRTKRQRREDKRPNTKLVPLEAKTDNQRDYIRSIIENDIIFCSGPAGSGKSFIAAGIAAQHLHHGKIEKIIVSRPLICTGKDIGSLPGEMGEKIAPYLLPMKENVKYFLGQALYGLYSNEGQIQYKPLEVMRGSTFHNTYMILDEAQNCTEDQIKMFVSRMGENSKVIINGDIEQNDLRGRSGLSYCMNKLNNVEGIGICKLDYNDIQRNGIIGRFLRALEN
jgi:phosphate starvation-inducible PhoH-like protein|tara:strand:+ start:2895 stop:3563 length:669 start_codon:yes stop_codon:yes gene_type:complete